MFIYFNNAATTFPKPAAVVDAVNSCLASPPAEPGRSSNGVDPTRDCRRELASLFNVADPRQVILTPSATYAINMVIRGHLLAPPQSHVITTVLEHNSVLRPLQHLEHDQRIELTYIAPEADGRVDPQEILATIRPDTRLIVVTHASNVTGCIQPVEEIARTAADAGIPFLIDASQSAGAAPLDYGRLPGRVFVAFAGHKGLFGPSGIGGLIVPDGRLPQTFVGGTGVQSEKLLHPASLPIRHEAGTMNLPGIAGLTAGVRFVQEQGVDSLGRRRHVLVEMLRDKLSQFPQCRLSPLANGDGRAGIVSFTHDRWSVEDLGFVLSESFGIETRNGLHCAPMVHRHLGTAPHGSIRISVAEFNTEEDVEKLAGAMNILAGTECAKC